MPALLDHAVTTVRDRMNREYTITVAQDWSPSYSTSSTATSVRDAPPASPQHPVDTYLVAADAYRAANRAYTTMPTGETLRDLNAARDAYVAAEEAMLARPYSMGAFAIPFAAATHGRP